MTFPVLVEQTNGRFTAMLLGAPQVSGVGESRSTAIAALEAEVQRRILSGELASVEITPRGVSHLAGAYADDPSLAEICEEAYAARDAERPQ